MGEAFRRTFLPDARAKPKPKPKKGKAKGKTGGATSDDDGDGDANVDADADEKAVIAAFARANRENALKTKPKVHGFLFFPPSLSCSYSSFLSSSPSQFGYPFSFALSQREEERGIRHTA